MTWTTRPRSDFGDLKAICSGAGPIVILLHGVGLRAEAWNAQIDALAERFTVIAPDMMGHGEGPQLRAAKPTLSDYTDVVAEALKADDRTSGQLVLVAGHSMGALMALDLAVRFPDRVASVAALNAVYQRPQAASDAVMARANTLDGQQAPDPTPTLERWFGSDASPQADACRLWLKTVNPAGYKTAYSTFAGDPGPASAALAQLHCPTLFLTGALEPNSTPAMSHAMAEVAPDGEAVVIQDAAHMAPMTHATEVNGHLLRFFLRCAQACQ